MTDTVPSYRRQWMLFAIVFAIVFTLLATGYYLVLTGRYTVLAEHLRPAEAAAIVAELDKRGTAYRVRDGGTTIEVPEGEADTTRLALVRSEAAATGQIGFELFNKSDMGLTNFAQRINFQRALQGELARTITAMDGVEAARVHLALPERSLFRDDRTAPTAAVTVTMRAGLAVGPARVAGIQRLVAAAVPDLSIDRVVVLDGEGRVISPAPTLDPDGRTAEGGAASGIDGAPDRQARIAAQNYYAARARAAIEDVRPALHYTLAALALPVHEVAGDAVRTGGARDFHLRVTLATPEPLDAATQAALRSAILPSVGLDEAAGDALLFTTGAPATLAGTAGGADRPLAPGANLGMGTPTPTPTPTSAAVPLAGRNWGGWGWLLALAGGMLVGSLWWRVTYRSSSLSPAERAAFARQLRRDLATGGERDDVVG